MQIHQLQPKHKLKNKKRVGRGGKKGTYSGRGGKGQTARSGRKMEPFIREIIKRYPKLKGYRQHRLPSYTVAVSLDALNKGFQEGEVVNPFNLVKKKMARMVKGKAPQIKILGKERLEKKLVIENCKISKSAKEAIEKAGGSIR